MDAVTYPIDAVAEFINSSVVPLRVAASQQPIADDFNVKWTPCLITLDGEGKELHRVVGFLSAEDMIPALLLGIGNGHFGKDAHQEAIDAYDKILADSAESSSAPEAIFHRAVSLYKSTGNPLSLREAYDLLQDKYPASQWTKLAYPYRLIE